MDILLTVLSRDESGAETSDPRRTLRLTGVSRLAASYRAGSWDDAGGAGAPARPRGSATELLRRHGGGPVYGWEFVDTARSERGSALGAPAQPRPAPWPATGGHHLTLFQDLGGGTTSTCGCGSADLSVLDGSGRRLDLDAFIAGGVRWWDAMYAGERSDLAPSIVGAAPEAPRVALVDPVSAYSPVVASVAGVTEESEAQGRSVLVTGGNRGIGRAIAEAFVAQGDKVAVTTRNGGAPDGTLDVRCDITDPEQVEAAFAQVEEAHGPVEVLVANAGITHDTLLLRMSEEDWSSVIETNLTGSYRLAKRAAKGMLRLRRGRIVFVSSVVGLLGSAGQVNYAASKAGLVGMARSIARELGSRSITANVVAPGFVETDMTGVLTDEQKAAIKAQVPLQRYATTDEVAAAVTWLAGDGAAYVTGAVIPVDGGLGMGH